MLGVVASERPGRFWDDSPYMRGWNAALSDSKAQIERMTRWRRGEDEECPAAGVETEYWKGVVSTQSLEGADEFREGYLAKWTIEVELFGNRLFKQEGE